MINSVKITNYLGQSMVMELRNPERSGFLLYNMTGVGPEKADIRTTDIVTADGGVYNSARLPSRNIVMNIRYYAWAGRAVEEIRQDSYKWFPIKKKVTISIYTENRIAQIDGYVESNEPVVFSQETHAQLSIVCPDPFFIDGSDDGLNVTQFYGVRPMFHFPYSNNSLTEKLTIMGEILFSNEETIVYSGDSEVGITIVIDVLGDVEHVTIWNVLTRESMVIDTDRLAALTGKGLVASDRLTIITTTGQKSITLLREGVETNVLNCLARGPDWFQLAKGNNIFAFVAEKGTTNLVFTIYNQTLYEGV